VYMNKNNNKLLCFLLPLRIAVLNYVGDMKTIVILTISFPDHIVSIIKKHGMYSFWHKIIVVSVPVDLFQDFDQILLVACALFKK